MISQLRKAFEDLAKLDAKTQSAELQLLKNNYGHSVNLLSAQQVLNLHAKRLVSINFTAD
jgi:hypothetical protein